MDKINILENNIDDISDAKEAISLAITRKGQIIESNEQFSNFPKKIDTFLFFRSVYCVFSVTWCYVTQHPLSTMTPQWLLITSPSHRTTIALPSSVHRTYIALSSHVHPT